MIDTCFCEQLGRSYQLRAFFHKVTRDFQHHDILVTIDFRRKRIEQVQRLNGDLCVNHPRFGSDGVDTHN